MGEEFTSKGLKDVIMSLEEELAEIKEEPAPGEEAMVDYFGRCEEDDEDDDDDDNDADLDYEPRKKSKRRKLVRKQGRGLRNMTYSHEQRMRMGYYGAKWGIKALKKKFAGVKDSTARDMCNCVMALVVDGILTLDLPLEQQVIPPKMRNGMPVQTGKHTKEKSNVAEPGPSREAAQNKTEEAPSPATGIGGKPKSPADVTMETGDCAFLPKSTKHAGKSPSPALSFQDKVKIGFIAAKDGSCVAVKRFDVSDTTVRECRNVVIRLFESGKLSEIVPLDQQEIPAQESGAAHPVRRGRPPAFAGRFISPIAAKAPLGSSRMITENSPPQTDHTPPTINDHLSERSAPWNPSEVPPSPIPIPIRLSPSPIPGPSPRIDNAQLHRGTRDIFLGSDLAFLRWRNIRMSLGFQNDEAFAMHLMDVHDAFCSTSCRGGGRNEHPHGAEVNNHC
ncbi:uncharacterized protein LOC119741859 [Patiria miniata]|uniref:Uncharacterized protein n=1 Tax=Patiria miniata TaxID=46514 RepID=A0A914BE52_PATMI|nr:uncharacterized protein LOC119741859 [Patiria miniata]